MFSLLTSSPSSLVDIRAIWEHRRNQFKRRRYGEKRHAVKRSGLQPGIGQDPGGLTICLNSSRADWSKDCLRDETSHTHIDECPYIQYKHAQRGLWKWIHIHTDDCIREPPCTWVCLLSCPQHVVSRSCLNVKSKNVVLDVDGEINMFLNKVAAFLWFFFSFQMCVLWGKTHPGIRP